METDVFLRVLEPDDLERVYKWHNDQTLYRDLVGTHHFVSRATVAKWLDQKGAFSNSEMNFAICLRSSSLHIGNAYIRDINWVDRNCVVHLFVGDAEQRQKGFGGQTVRLMAEYVFRTMGLNRIYTLILADNETSLKMFRKAGFIEEGTLRRHVYQDGAFHDVKFVALCRAEWEQSHP